MSNTNGRRSIKSLCESFVEWFNNKEKLKFILWDLSGLRYIYNMIKPKKEHEQRDLPSKFIIWLISIYIVCWGLAMTKYELKNSYVMNQISVIVPTILEEDKKNPNTYEILVKLQHEEIPLEPTIYNPLAVFKSITEINKKPNKKSVELIKKCIIINKETLKNINLNDVVLNNENLSYSAFNGTLLNRANFSGSNLVGSDFENAKLLNVNLSYVNKEDINNVYNTGENKNENTIINLSHTIMSNADLSNSNFLMTDFSEAIVNNSNFSNGDFSDSFFNDIKGQSAVFKESKLQNAKFSDAKLSNGNFSGANLTKANFTDANLNNTDFSNANFLNTILIGVDFSEAKLENSKNLTVDQLKTVKTLYGAKLPSKLEKELGKSGYLDKLREKD